MDVESVLGLYLEEDKVSAAGWEDGLGLSTVALVNKD